MFRPLGANANELGDIDVLEHGGELHLFHLVLPNHDLVAHATSTDGLHWTPAPVALRTGDPGDCDDDMIWTMHTVKKPDSTGFLMYYTACSLKERGQIQRVAVAESADLKAWRKLPGNPILQPAPPYYNDDIGQVGFVSFRDPFVFVEDGLWHMLVTARTLEGPRFRSGCLAHATSADGIDWKLGPPIYAPQSFEDIETPAIVNIEGRYYLFFNEFGVGQTYYRIASSLEGPWLAPDPGALLPPGNSVFRFCRWRDRLLAYHWIRGQADWPTRSGAEYYALAPPKEVNFHPDGVLSLSSFSGWQSYHQGGAGQLGAHDFADRTGPGAVWVPAPGEGLSVRVNGLATATAKPRYADFIAEFEVQLDSGHACGLAFRTDDDFEVANWLRLDFATNTIQLHRSMFFDSALERYKLKKPSLIQASPVQLKCGQRLLVRLLACREYIEVSIDGQVYLSAVTYKAQKGRIALWAEDGAATFFPVSIQPIRQIP